MENKGTKGQGKKAESAGLPGAIEKERELDIVIAIGVPEIEMIDVSGTAERQGFIRCEHYVYF